ncbi:TolB family protein [Stigmatella erecta]|uniref:TolB protein n=1 Tax=Stigmatella erecta TaxID=83460 RepID=A0A1I0KWT6_9BACT|nr:LpqB family beta-propeller domain-containing protein [Stigmatella erecta]SEU30830.1 TolB protein [Stigmatella erecta]
MTQLGWKAGALVLALGLTACENLEFGDGGGGGGGGSVLFSRGFVFVREDRNLYVVDDRGDANDPQRLTTGGGVSHPSVDRSGRLAVFVQQTSDFSSEIRTVPTAGTGAPSTVIASGDTACRTCTQFRYPTFSPDGRVIVFSFNDGSGALSLGRVNVDGSGFQELTPNTSVSFGAPSFYPDGLSVLVPAGFNSGYLNQLKRVTLANGVIANIADNLNNEVVNRAVVSPDGTQVVFDGGPVSGSRIYVASLRPSFGVPSRLSDHPGEPRAQDTYPSWMSNSQIGFLSNAGNTQSIYRITVGAVAGAGTFLIPTAAEPSYGGL